jgi:hypothetical protein
MPNESSVPDWRLPTRLAFRFFAVYFSLYVLFTQMLSSLLVWPGAGGPSLEFLTNGLVAWVGAHIFHVTAAPVLSGSGDKLFDWVQAFCLLMLAIVGAVVWSILDRRRLGYDKTYRHFRVFLRFALGSTMLSYGIVKAFPLQMPAPPLTRLLEPYGNFSPMGVLWYSIGASFPYERFVGCAELAAAVLLFIPRTARLGALVALADTIEIFTLNMTYDVPVKLFAFHLVMMSAFLAAPDLGRLVRVVFADGARTRWAAGLQVAFGLYLVAFSYVGARRQFATFGWGAPKPALYGVWVIDEMMIDGTVRPPLVTDLQRWRRVVIDRATTLTFWRMDDTFVGYPAVTDEDSRTITLSKPNTKDWSAKFTVDRQTPQHAIFEGTMDGHVLRLDAHLVRREDFLIVSRGFHWIQELPFNR